MQLARQLLWAFEEFAENLRAHTAPFARERELVSLFAFGPLIGAVRPDGELRDRRQIGVEVAVPQHGGGGRKRFVCKDLVIWGDPGMACWGASGRERLFPRAVIEWKATTSSRQESFVRLDTTPMKLNVELEKLEFLVLGAKHVRLRLNPAHLRVIVAVGAGRLLCVLQKMAPCFSRLCHP